MLVVWLVTALSAALMLACVAGLLPELRAAPRAWRLLAGSGIPLALGGVGFILRFWEPLPGPYLANSAYPLGSYLNAWAVSFGFMWLSFGLIFYALALRAPRTILTWWVLAVGWFLAWLPHGIIGIGFAAAGSNAPSMRLYRGWAAEWPGVVQLSASALILVAHFGLATLGFIGTGRALWRQRRAAPVAP